MMNPVLWQVVPFKDPDAFTDFLWVHDQAHLVLAKLTGVPWFPTDDLKQNPERHAQAHIALAKALQIPQVDDLQSFDLSDETSYLSFMLINSQDHMRLNTAAGVS